MGKSDKNSENSSPKIRREILYDGNYYDVTDFIKRHPGGSIIEFYTHNGEDATHAIQQFHNRSFKRVSGIMNSLKKRPAETAVKATEHFDEETLARHKRLTEDFNNLYREFENEGLFKPAPLHIIIRLMEMVGYAIIGTIFGLYPGFLCKALAVFFLSAFVSRSGWFQHEGGHHSLTGWPTFDRALQTVFLGLGFGLSSTWWQRNHNMHHSMPNRFHRDHDLDTLPLVVFNKIIVKNPKNDGQNFFVQNQAKLFLLVSNLIGVMAWKVWLHPLYTIRKKEYHVLAVMVIHWIWMVYTLGFWAYIFSVWLTTNYFFGNFSLSHTHLPATDKPMHWVEYSFLHTMNVRPSLAVNWWMGYLNFQIEHHLFPTMPQFRAQYIWKRVEKFAETHGINYNMSSYCEAVHLTYQNMLDVSKELKELKSL